MALPTVTVVGRPNVGKSSLLNMLAGRRISIVEPTAGVTRDRIQAMCEHRGVFFDVVDTGGYGIVDRDDLSVDVERQIAFAVREATLILFVVDGREGIVPLDQAVAHWLRASTCPVLLLANKIDAPDMPNEVGELSRLGYGEPLPVSALHHRGEKKIKNWIVENLPDETDTRPADPVMKIAIVGRRNAGKSTFINALAGQERTIVSEIPGTTRDAVDVRFEHNGQQFIAIDTAGVRKKAKIADDVEYYGYHRAELSIRRADVVLFMMDATKDVGSVDKKLGRYIVDQYKPCIQVINKWDLAKDRASTEDFGEYLFKTMSGLAYAPVAFTTAMQSKNVQTVINLATELFKQSRARVSTGELNRVINAIMEDNVPRPGKGRNPVRILYATQVAVCPPTIVLFVNDTTRIATTFERFLISRLRDMLPFAEVPIRIIYRGRRALRAAKERAESGTKR